MDLPEISSRVSKKRSDSRSPMGNPMRRLVTPKRSSRLEPPVLGGRQRPNSMVPAAPLMVFISAMGVPPEGILT